MKKRSIPKDGYAHEKAWDSYYSIGHSAGGVIWIYRNGRIESVEHKKDEIHDDYWEIDDHTIRGRYDPKSGELTILTYKGRMVPQSIVDKLESEFPDALEITHYSVDY